MNMTEKAFVERPKYRVLDTAGFFGPDDTLYEEGTEIYFDGIPSEQMEPLNDAAYQKYVAYIESLEEEGRKVAEKTNRPYTGRPRNLDGNLVIATAIQKQEMALMSAHKDTSSISVAEPSIPETGKRGRGRPRKVETLAKVANS